MIIDQLRAATGEAHKELDSSLMPVFSGITNRDSYAEILQSFYGFFSPLMQKINAFVTEEVVADKATRRNADVALQDLAGMGIVYNTRYTATDLPLINSVDEAMGAYYVLEGSTMGGVYLSKIIRDKLNLENNDITSFFYGYGKESREQWQRFIDSLNSLGAKSKDPHKIIEAANETFLKFKLHLEEKMRMQTSAFV